MRDKTFVIMAGGTGGHVFPALAVAQSLMNRADKVVWLGSKGGMEESVIGATDIPFYGISISGIRGKHVLGQILAPFKILAAIYQAFVIMLKVKPDAVLGMGGFASGPGGVAARLLGVPLLIHEQNSVAGMTNKLLAKVAVSVMTAFPNAFENAGKFKVYGNPLRSEIERLYFEQKQTVSDGSPIRLLVLGGSLGAQILNEMVPEAIKQVNREIRPLIRHQTGKLKHASVIQRYQSLDIEAEVTEFISDMAEAYRWADFVICRAGALTISELCVAGLGAILIPYPHAVDDHQTKNAEFMVQGGAAWLLPQSELTVTVLAGMLNTLFGKVERIRILSEAARKLALVNATEAVAAECRRVCYA